MGQKLGKINEKSAYIVPPLKGMCVCVWEGAGGFQKTFFIFGTNIFGQTNDQIMLAGEGNVFSSNLNTVNLKIFPNHVGIYTYILDDTAKP